MTAPRTSVILCIAMLVGWSAITACGDSISETAVDDGNQARESSGERSQRRADFLLVPADSRKQQISREGTSSVEVLLYDQRTGQPADAGEIISFEIVEGQDTVGTLTSNRAETDDEGAASVGFRARGRTGVAKVRVHHSGADPLTLTLRTVERARGTLNVDVVNTGDFVVSLSDITVRLYQKSRMTCDDFAPLNTRQPSAFAQRVKAKPGTTADFGSLRADKTFTVTAVARGERGQLAAGGCQGDVSVEEGSMTEETLLLELISLRPEGRYELTTEWDLSRALDDSGAIGKNLSRIFDIFNDPGQALYDGMMNLVKDYVNSILGRALDWFLKRTGLDTRIQDAINSTIQNNEVLCKLREAGRDLRDTVSNLHVQSELTIGQVQSNYEFQGRDNWLGVTLYWRGQCQDAYEEACSGSEDRNDIDDRQRRCAAIRLTADSDGKLGELGVVSSQWTGRITAYNKLRIGQHPLPLRYGRLVKYVFNQVILPELTNGNASSLTGAFSHWLGCEDLARSITGGQSKVCALGNNACLEASRIEQFCSSSIGSLFGAANLVIGGLEYDTDIYVGGEADLVEVTSDGRIDYMENGIYRGYLSVSGEPDQIIKGRSNIRATWRGERVSSPSSGTP